jgi:hypothetical protein
MNQAKPVKLKKEVTFLKKSNQKTFIPLRAALPVSGPPRPKGTKSFLRAFFQKSASFLPFWRR